MTEEAQKKLSKYLSQIQIDRVEAALLSGKPIILSNKLSLIQKTCLKIDLKNFFGELAYDGDKFFHI